MLDVVMLHNIHNVCHITVRQEYNPVTRVNPGFPEIVVRTDRLKP
jgi:hypothetical protein